jgi:serine/threonine protein kinase
LIMIGQTISHYKILEKLGGGGMGVVYKAEDTKLKRTVALKFLPPVYSFDKEAKQRFINEAQAASSLDHNNICAIHEVGETNDGQIFICMNCYDGETLKKKIERGQIKTDEAIDIIVQVATGLQKAHEKGIIHRDIKPANIFITNDGVVKILDFGLAKLSGQTMMTKMGETVGTIAYMSPEQTRGELVDNRTDIWSLGVVLYEMLTRNLPFKGEYDSAMIYSILNSNPEPIPGLRDDIPVEMEQIVNKCLDKDKEYRYQRIDDLLTDLKRFKRETSGVSVVSGGLKRKTTQAGVKTRGTFRKKYALWSAGTLLVAAVCAIIFLPSRSDVQLNPKRTIRTLNLPFKEIMYPSISADGNWIAFPAIDINGDWNIYLTHSSGGEAPVSLVNEKKQFIFFAAISPDGSSVIYEWGGPSRIKIISTSGGVPKILDSLENFRNPQWSPDGRNVGGVNGTGDHNEFWTASREGNDLRKEFTDTIGGQLFRNFFFAWSPDGKSVAFQRDFKEGSGYQEIFTRELETGKEKQITFAKSNIEAVCWSSENMIIFSAAISGPLNLWMVPAEGGELIQITSGDGPDGPPSISKDCSKIIYPKMKMIGQIMVVPITGGDPKLVTGGEQTIWWPGAKLSPDRSQVAVNVGDLRFGWAGVRAHLYIIDRDGKNSQRITVGEEENLGSHSWSPDGKWLAFESNSFFDNSGYSNIHILNAVGNNQPKKISRVDQFRGLIWIDSLNLSIRTKDKFYSYSIDQNKMVEDTVLYYPIIGKREILMQTLEGIWWIVKEGKKNKLEPPKDARLSLRNLCWTQWERGKPFRTISLIDGKVKEYPNLIGPKLLGIHNLSDDGKEIIFSTQEFSGQISMIENPFLK